MRMDLGRDGVTMIKINKILKEQITIFKMRKPQFLAMLNGPCKE